MGKRGQVPLIPTENLFRKQTTATIMENRGQPLSPINFLGRKW